MAGTSVLKLKVDDKEYNASLKQAQQGMQHLEQALKGAGKSFTQVDKSVVDYIRSIGQMDTQSKTARGSINEMSNAFISLSVDYNKMADDVKQSDVGKALAASLDQLKTRIQEEKSQLDDINKSINGGGGLTGALDNMLGKVGLNVEGLMKFGGAAGAATTALKVAKDAFFASETSLDEWGRTVQSSQSLYQGFLSALNNSDISGFLSRMDEIVSAARDAYNAMDELGTFSAFQQRNVAKGRAGYAQALDEYRLNPTADNKQKLAQANQKVMNDLRESHDKTEDAYQAALRQIATERISGKGMQDAFVKMFSEGNYGDLQAAKSSYKTGRGLNSGAQYYYGDRVYDGRVQDRTTGKWRDMSATEKQQFEFARALSQVNDSQIKEVQALGAQSVAITEQIYQQDRAYNRLAGNNAPLRSGGGHRSTGGGSTSGGRSGGGSRIKSEPTYAADSIAAQAKLVQDLTKQWNEAGADVRDKYIPQIVKAEQKLKDMKNQLTLAREQSQGRLLGGTVQTQNLGSVISTNTTSVSDTMSTIVKLRKKVQEEINAEDLKIDQNIFKEVFRVAVQNGIDGMDIQFSALSEKIAKGINIPDDAWESLKEQINEKLKDMGLDPIEINFKTGKLSDPNSDSDSDDNGNGNRRKKKEKYEPESVSQVINDLSGNVGGILAGLNQLGVDIPEGLQGIIGGIQGMMTILTSISSILSIIEALQAVSSLPFFSHGGIIGRAAAGMLIPGNSNSGDNLRLPMMDGSGFIGVNSGELILNKSQQNNLANALEGGGLQGMNLSAQVSGEQILLVANRTLRRKGKGELVTWK